MIEYRIELSGENPRLAAAELRGAAEALGGRTPGTTTPAGSEDPARVALPEHLPPARLADRLALAHRVLRWYPEESVSSRAWARSVSGTASFRPLGRPRAAVRGAAAQGLVDAWRAGGGRVRLERPDREFVYEEAGGTPIRLAEVVARVDRSSFELRRMPKLPFRRPVSLTPRLGRAAANLARVGTGRWTADPFLGTGALLAEAALLGASVGGGDRDAEMLRGALRNFHHLGVELAIARVGDAGDPFPPPHGGAWDSLLTDPPYGRASSTGGESADALVGRALRRWAPFVVPGGPLVVIGPAERSADLGPDWELLEAIPDRVHRSLTREFRRYRRADRLS